MDRDRGAQAVSAGGMERGDVDRPRDRGRDLRPDAIIQDTTFDVESETERALGGAIARGLDAAILFGEDAPPGFPADGIATTPATGADALDALGAAMSAVEASGVAVSGIVSGPAIGSALRTAYTAAGALPAGGRHNCSSACRSASRRCGTRAKGDTIVDAFEYLVARIRRDITVETSRDGVLTDDDGTIVANAFQDDVTLVRAHARFAVAVGKPISASGDPIVPFATAQWTAS